MRNIIHLISLTIFFFLGVIAGNLDRLATVSSKLFNYTQSSLGNVVEGTKDSLGSNLSKINSISAKKADVLYGKMVDIVDGDTATLVNGDDRYKIRFYGIDAPEKSQEYGPEARDFLKKLINNRIVSVEVVDVDHYGRIVGKVYIQELYVNRALVRNGNAWYYKTYAPNDIEIGLAQQEARNARIGLWNNTTAIPPWEYRKKK